MSIRWLVVLALASFALVPPLAGQRSAPRPRARLPLRVPFEIVSCSLGCTPALGGLAISCGVTNIHVNEEVRITFNQPVDPTSVLNNSFHVIEAGTGRTAPATFALDPADPTTLVWRPQMFFDSAGNPIFGLSTNHTYFLKLPGTSLDSLGPYVTSIDGEPNRTRMLCTLVASEGVADAVAGRPVAKLFVRAVLERDPLTGEPVRTARVPAAGATDVLRSSPIEIVFGDLMNPATVANPVTGQSTFLRVFFDPDGNVQDRSDQVPVLGTFGIQLDQLQETTRAIFFAQGGLPAAGDRRGPGRVVVELLPQIQDLAGNSLANPGLTSFTTEAR